MCVVVYIHQVNSKEHLKEDHRLYKAWVIEQAIQLLQDGATDIETVTTLTWPGQAVIRTLEIYESIWECPPEKHMKVEDYVSMYICNSACSLFVC